MTQYRIAACTLLLVGCASSSGDGSGSQAGAASLVGDWEIIGTSIYGPPESVLVSVGPTHLTVTASNGSLSAAASGNTFRVQARRGSRDFTFDAARTPGDGDTGVIPLPLFGDWQASAAGAPGCEIAASPNQVSARCENVVELYRWAPDLNGQLTATRVRPLDSIFGDFGGEWEMENGYGDPCTATVSGNQITLTCEGPAYASGTASVTLRGDTAQGSSSEGYEFTAHRL